MHLHYNSCSPYQFLCCLRTKLVLDSRPRLDTETKGSRNPRALGCRVPSAARALLKGPRVSKSQCLTNLEYSNSNYASASVVNKRTYESEVLFNEITDWKRVRQILVLCALAALGTLQPRALGFLNRVDPLVSVSNLYRVHPVQPWLTYTTWCGWPYWLARACHWQISIQTQCHWAEYPGYTADWPLPLDCALCIQLQLHVSCASITDKLHEKTISR